jgi:mono/diheme cytochrome c family protein
MNLKLCSLLLLFSVAGFAASCKKEQASNLSPEEQLKADGRKLYIANCIACHSADVDQDGTVGPALKSSTFEILKAKLLEGKYPPGYKGKRPISGSMPKYNFTDEQIRSLEAFLH